MESMATPGWTQQNCPSETEDGYPDSKVHAANLGPICGWQDPGGPHVGPMNLAILVYVMVILCNFETMKSSLLRNSGNGVKSTVNNHSH